MRDTKNIAEGGGGGSPTFSRSRHLFKFTYKNLKYHRVVPPPPLFGEQETNESENKKINSEILKLKKCYPPPPPEIRIFINARVQLLL